jgi:opacity protein-like surface antigen
VTGAPSSRVAESASLFSKQGLWVPPKGPAYFFALRRLLAPNVHEDFHRKGKIHAQRFHVWTLKLVVLAIALVVAACEVLAQEKDDVYISLYAQRSLPSNRNAFLGGEEMANTIVANGMGAGIKIGVFPAIAKGVVGFEVESSGHGGEVTFPLMTNSKTASTNLLVFNSMVNAIVRYPGEFIRPYIGIGAGLSQGILTSPNIPGRADTDFEGARSFGHQYLAGAQGMVSKRAFLFAEYKYLSANYHWEKLSLDFRSHYVIAGIGIRF